MALVTWYSTGTVSVESGSTTVTGADLFWGDDAIMPGDLFCDPAQPLVPPQRVREVTADNVLELWAPWPGTTITDAPYEIRYAGIIERSTAQTRRVLEQLGDVKAWADMFVEDDAARLALDTASNPLRSGVRVLVVDEGMIWQKASSVYGDWVGPAEFKGDKGDKGWAPQLAGETAGARRALKLIGYVGGEGAAPTANVGKYLKGDGTFTDVIAEAMDIRGPTGDMTGVTPFWQSRITADADAAAARAGLGALGVGDFGVGGGEIGPSGIDFDWDDPYAENVVVFNGNSNPPAGLAFVPGLSLGPSGRLQLAGRSNRLFIRDRNGGHAWQEIWTELNLPVGSQAEWVSGTGTSPRALRPDRFPAAVAAHIPSEIYRRSNILGTVSQSGGVPTGGIIERGSNASGQYVRFADGTQICTREVNIDLSSLTGQIFFSPASFVRLDAGGIIWKQSAESWAGASAAVSLQWVEGQWRARPSLSGTYGSLPAGLFAVGRWFD